MTPVQSECKRCEKLFCYFVTTNSRRAYCSTCRGLERADTLLFLKVQRRRRALGKAMECRSVKPLARVAASVLEAQA